MIPPWSEAEKAIVEKLAEALEFGAGCAGQTAWKYANDHRLADTAGAAVARDAANTAHKALALRACLARAEQADRLEQERAAFRDEANAVRRNLLAEVRDMATRADAAEQQIIPVADREQGAACAYAAGVAHAEGCEKLAQRQMRHSRAILKLEDA